MKGHNFFQNTSALLFISTVVIRSLLLIFSFFIFTQNLAAQKANQGKVVIEKFLSPSLQDNHGGEDPMRRVTIYLPPGYEESTHRYPVLYFLHGFVSNDSLMMVWNSFNELMDAAILSSNIHPMILVLPNSDNNYGGSFYTNSSLTGNWADYIAKDVVNYMDKKYRTIPNRNSRGLTGHSMGGNGALKIGMLYPEIFGAVYALSPAVLGWGAEFSITNPAFKGMDLFRNEFSSLQITESLIKGDMADFLKKFYTKLFAGLARTYSPDEGKSFLSAKMPITYIGDSMVVNEEVKKKWETNFPLNMIENHLSALKSLNAIKIDWGRNEESKHIPITCIQFSKKLEANGVKHFSEEYLGGHIDKQGGLDGRIYTEVLPFFEMYLKFDGKSSKNEK
ncbi:MAG: alpha/beta hydrolase-fold protein [Haliscomenobacter sp.]|uniref:alpha/beta hydrolase n=1 Tax=Haliscomenobacter sp. TaxID=2717303 RepID=UPI0029AF5FB3|nr:alpha/beta hydrolase-fold protein [Haliscomenobacter sp.]MDX2071047.1 alpha/beta hydrolase-fold protein [Haliscomenobacter sp.]